MARFLKTCLPKDLHKLRSPIFDDESLCRRICERYEHYGGTYAGRLYRLLKPLHASVFTHGDLARRNMLVGEYGSITGVVDWENAGWHLEYWEYGNIMKPSGDRDWQDGMAHTAPEISNLSAFVAARRILF